MHLWCITLSLRIILSRAIIKPQTSLAGYRVPHCMNMALKNQDWHHTGMICVWALALHLGRCDSPAQLLPEHLVFF